MPKELPYFQFNASEWISGSITLEPLTVQGAFISICAFYWFRGGQITAEEIKRRLKLKQPTFKRLVDSGLIKMEEQNIRIAFLDFQIARIEQLQKTNRNNGMLGGAPKGNKNAEKNNRPVDLKQPKTTNIDIDIDKEGYIYTYGVGNNFILILPKTLHSPKARINGGDGLAAFMEANQSILNLPQYADKFMRYANGKVYNDMMHVRNAYDKFIEKNPI